MNLPPRPSADDLSPDAALAALAWQIDMGVTEAICDAPVDRFDAPPAPRLPRSGQGSNIGPVSADRQMPAVQESAADIARIIAGRAATLADLRNAMGLFEHCALKKGARNLVFADGNPAARVMVIGDAPTRDEDRQGRPFVGAAGALLDRMFAAIDLGRDRPEPEALYIANAVPWRPPQNRDPGPEELAMLLPFLERHVALVSPAVIVAMGNTACMALLGRAGVSRIRGRWTEALGRPVLPMFNPASVLLDPTRKKACWADLLALRAALA